MSFFSLIVVARQLDRHTVGYITYKGGLQSSMNTTLVRETDQSRMQFTIQVMAWIKLK